VTDEAAFRQQIETLLPLYWRRFDADLGERILSSTVLSAEAAEAGGALAEGWSVVPRLGEISAPRLVLVGRDDFICPPSQARIMHERIPNSELVVFEQSGHFPYIEEPEAFFDAVRGWLQRT
jgi:proline iminopeptidase